MFNIWLLIAFSLSAFGALAGLIIKDLDHRVTYYASVQSEGPSPTFTKNPLAHLKLEQA